MKPAKRARATAIIQTAEGIIFVLLNGPFAILPGGGVEDGETDKEAITREVKEELNLDVASSEYLFSVMGNDAMVIGGRLVVNHYKVFSVKANGAPTPQNEIKKVLYYKKGSQFPMSRTAAKILEKYLAIER